MKMLKETVRRILRLLFAPVHLFYSQRNGAALQMASKRELPNDILLGLVSEKLQEGHTAVMMPKGFSMRPFIECDRDKVKLKAPDTLHVGDAVLAQISPGKYVLHRIIRLDGEEVTLQGDGNVRGVEKCSRKDISGIVTEYIRPTRTLRADDSRLMRNIRWWYRLRPFRRFLLIIYNAIV